MSPGKALSDSPVRVQTTPEPANSESECLVHSYKYGVHHFFCVIFFDGGKLPSKLILEMNPSLKGHTVGGKNDVGWVEIN